MAAAAETVVVTEVSVGDLVHFPNSRRPQKVEQVMTEGDHTTLVSGDASWMVSNLIEVRREVREAEEG